MATTYHPSWIELFTKWDSVNKLVDDLYASNQKVYPPKECVFKVFEMPVENIRVVLLGQDVYHHPGQAMGLSFSVPKGVRIPPSLVNIFKEIKNEYPERSYKFDHGDLTRWWKEEGIFLLNCALTVKEFEPGSHMKLWTSFTDDVIRFISERNKSCMFLLFGNFAKAKIPLIASNKYVYTVHPSPLSAHGGFFGSGVFKKTEEALGCKIEWFV